jgi:hypothetical protein
MFEADRERHKERHPPLAPLSPFEEKEEFSFDRIHKLQDRIEETVYLWVESAITDHFEIDTVLELTHKQIDELAIVVHRFNTPIDSYAYEASEAERIAVSALNSIMDHWGDENDDDYCFDMGYR